MFKVIICGSRSFNSLSYLTEKCDYLLSRKSDIEIVSGMARGADYLGSVYGNNHDYKLSGFEAEWDKYGKSAGFKRNRLMGDYADACIAFWDGASSGTKHMIEYMKKLQKPVKIILYTQDKKYVPDY